MCGNHKDSSEIALNVDLHLPIHRRQHDLVHQRAQDVRRLDPLRLVVTLKCLIKLLHPSPVLQRH
ncbi:hypothetical protein [Brucella anthropi]|uniref:hypothetical protein n=1 Tax=Brucella anthropi TaxID=529 RepID=UPI001F328AA5|nr:hypothetical protein [Brucella anthropi]